MITFDIGGDFNNTKRYLQKLSNFELGSVLEKIAQDGVVALEQSTPKDTGYTSGSWSYEVIKSRRSYQIVWKNSHINQGVPIVILIQYGHGTGTGGYVSGRDFINPTMRPIFDKLLREAERAVKSL